MIFRRKTQDTHAGRGDGDGQAGHARLASPRWLWAVCGSALILSGCAVGPDFVRPDPPEATGYVAEPLPAQTAATQIPGGAAQRFIVGGDIPNQWWRAFQSEPLNALIEQALQRNPDLQAAQASLRAARENVFAQRGAYLPSVEAGASASRGKAAGESIYTLRTAQVSVSYALDIFGGNRRLVEALRAEADFQRFQLEAAYLSLTSNVVAAVIRIASLHGQIEATRSTIEFQQEHLELLRRQVELGALPMSNVITQEAELAQSKARLPSLMQALAQQHNFLTVLTGRYPSEAEPIEVTLASLQLPRELPISVPSALVRQRPDIRAAEALLHAASAQVGVATADRFPRFILTADMGSLAAAGGLFSAGTGFWSVLGGLTQPLFAGGSLLHRQRAAEALYDQAASAYRSTVLSAFQDVADTLLALKHDADALAAAYAAERATHERRSVARRQMELGDVSYLELLLAEQAYLETRIALVEAQAYRYADTAALFQALGGGWWSREAGGSAEATAEVL